MIPHRRAFPSPVHVWLISSADGHPMAMRYEHTITLDDLLDGWSAKKVRLGDAIRALADTEKAHVKPPRRTLRSRLRAFITRHIVADVPPELDACESCRVPRCTAEQAATCKLRLAAKELTR